MAILSAILNLPDHLLLTWNLTVPHNVNKKLQTSQTRRKYDLTNIGEDFMKKEKEHIQRKISDIEEQLAEKDKLNEAYESFLQLLEDEMGNHIKYKDIKINTNAAHHHKSKRKPYWCNELQQLWDNVKDKEKCWFQVKGSGVQASKKKEDYCSARKCFDRTLRRHKRRYQQDEQLELLRMSDNDQFQFWQKFGNIGIGNERKNPIPNEVVDDDGTVHTELQIKR